MPTQISQRWSTRFESAATTGAAMIAGTPMLAMVIPAQNGV